MITVRSRRITAELAGAAEDNGAVRLDALEEFLHHLHETLAAVEKEISHEQRQAIVYRVVGLSCASPTRVTLEAVPGKDQKDIGPDVVSRFAREVEQVNLGEYPEGIETTTLDSMRKLSAGYKKNLTSIRFEVEEQRIYIPSDFEQKIQKLLGNVYRTHGTFRGRLQALNLHNDRPMVYIYPVAGPNRIKCIYRRGMFPNLGALLDQEPTVEVYGVMKYRGDSPHPTEIEVEEITPLPPESELPTVDEIALSMPNLTGGKDIASYLRDVRGNG